MENEKRIPVEQLRVGMFVHLDIGWMNHPFSFNSFKLRDEEQILIIRQLGLKAVRWSPERSDVGPARPAGGASAARPASAGAPIPDLSAIEHAAKAAKQARIRRLAEHRERIARAEREFARSAKIVRSLGQTIFSLPDETLKEASSLIDRMTGTLLAAPDLAIYLVGEHANTEEAYSHPLNVSVLAMLLARELGMSADDVHAVGLGALFHDIGLSQVPARIVHSGEPLNKAEREFMEMHCQYGVDIGRKAGLPEEVLRIILQHHELFDGSGYPARLKGEGMAPSARVVSLANAFETLCNPPNLAKSLTPHEALAQMYAQYRARFDPHMLKLFIRFMGVYPAGTVVSLSNGTLGMVIAVSPAHPLKPTVVVYDPDIPKQEAIVLDLAEETEVNITRGIRPDQLLPAVYDYLSPRRRVKFYFDGGQRKEGTSA